MRQSVIHETNANTTSFGFKGSLKSLKCIFDECIKCYDMSFGITLQPDMLTQNTKSIMIDADYVQGKLCKAYRVI